MVCPCQALARLGGRSIDESRSVHLIQISSIVFLFQLSINVTDFFGNLLALNLQHRRAWNRRLREGEDRDDWIFNTFDTNLAVYWYWDEIIVPAGTSSLLWSFAFVLLYVSVSFCRCV